MKRIVKKSLSVLLAVILASAMFVTAFAEDPIMSGIEFFGADINYQTNCLNSFNFAVFGYSVANEEDFACSIYDSQQNEVFNETMADFYFMTPEFADADLVKRIAPQDEPEIEFIFVDFYLLETVTLNPDETYTLVIAEGSFSNAAQELSPEMTCEFLPSDYIYIPTIWDKILYVLNSNPVLQVLFARVIMIIEFFYYIPWFPIPLFG